MGQHRHLRMDGLPDGNQGELPCRDSILAAPIALDLVLFSDLAMRAGMCGIQTWLSFFCKSPMHDFEHQPEHDLFTQWRMVKQTLRNMIGEKEPDYLA